MTKKLSWCVCITVALVLTCLNTHFCQTEEALASGVIRLHVVANSNTAADQELKLKVRDRILSETGNLFDSQTDIAIARSLIASSLEKIESLAENEIRKNGYTYSVKVSLGKSRFPTKTYGELVLPAGTYEALKIEIGEAEGRNWWCVLFPPLCFVDESCVSIDSQSVRSIEHSIGEENRDLIASARTGNAEIRFKTYEIWQKSRQKLAMLLN